MSICIDMFNFIEYNFVKAHYVLSIKKWEVNVLKIDQNRLEIWMARRGMTGAQVANAANMTTQLFSTIKIRGTCTPRNLARIANALGVDVTELMEEVKQA